ncbi:MAG: FAD-dependent oxidoreductase [Planctomycetota bacterium]|nr:FAD-dependent oxidoreductase [Planctomycetota bacterium]
MTTYILGGGPAGLAVAHGLCEEGRGDFVLVERGDQLGGLARTVEWPGHGHHDLGPHKLFTLDEALWSRVETLLPPDGWLVREKVSRIFLHGHYLPYPPSPFSLVKVFGVRSFAHLTATYGWARLRCLLSADHARTFEEDLVRRVGGGLYRALFEPIARKLWGNPAALDAKLSRARVQTPSVTEVIAHVLGRRKKSEFEALTFRYPAGGLQKLWDAVRRATEGQGRFLLRHEVRRIEMRDGAVRAIECRHLGEDKAVTLEVGEEDFVVSTVPMGRLADFLGEALPRELREGIRRVLVLNDLILVFLKVAPKSLLDESWIFVPDPEVVFHRISEQESFDPEMATDGSIVCCEIMSNEGRPLMRESDDELVNQVRRGLDRMGLGEARVVDQRVIRLPKTYPVYRPGFEEDLDRILDRLDEIRNLRTIGRQGAFHYIGSLDAMDIGYGIARWLSGGAGRPWGEERERTRHYPVLD